MKVLRTIGLTLVLMPMMSGVASAQSAADSTIADAWKWRATLYGWLPDFRAGATVPVPGVGEVNVDSDPGHYLSKLQFEFMGTLEARKGPWSIVGDAIYVDFGNAKSNVTSIGPMRLPAPVNANIDLKGYVAELEAGYSLLHTPEARLDVVGGARYLRLTTRIDYELIGAPPGVPPQGGIEKKKQFWDGVIGLRGTNEVADHFFVPYYVDVGTGSSNVTWQAFAGLGYHFSWGDAMAGYRYLSYQFHSSQPVSDLTFAGPIVGVGFNF